MFKQPVSFKFFTSTIIIVFLLFVIINTGCTTKYVHKEYFDFCKKIKIKRQIEEPPFGANIKLCLPRNRQSFQIVNVIWRDNSKFHFSRHLREDVDYKFDEKKNLIEANLYIPVIYLIDGRYSIDLTIQFISENEGFEELSHELVFRNSSVNDIVKNILSYPNIKPNYLDAHQNKINVLSKELLKVDYNRIKSKNTDSPILKKLKRLKSKLIEIENQPED